MTLSSTLRYEQVEGLEDEPDPGAAQPGALAPVSALVSTPSSQ